MIDIHAETLISFSDAAKSLPGRPSVVTLWRWRSKGVRGVRLDSVLYGGRRMTSAEALQRFVAATTAAADGRPTPPTARTPAARERAIAQAEAELRRAGV